MLRISLIAIASIPLLSGCGRPPPAKAPNGMVEAAPAIPAWVDAYSGKPLTEVFPGASEQCLGFVDKIETRYIGEPDGVQVVGWGWSTSGSHAYERVVAVDQDGVIRGGGESGIDRSDVPIAIPAVQDSKVGYSATSLQTKGALRVFGIAGTSACQLGPEIQL